MSQFYFLFIVCKTVKLIIKLAVEISYQFFKMTVMFHHC